MVKQHGNRSTQIEHHPWIPRNLGQRGPKHQNRRENGQDLRACGRTGGPPADATPRPTHSQCLAHRPSVFPRVRGPVRSPVCTTATGSFGRYRPSPLLDLPLPATPKSDVKGRASCQKHLTQVSPGHALPTLASEPLRPIEPLVVLRIRHRLRSTVDNMLLPAFPNFRQIS